MCCGVDPTHGTSADPSGVDICAWTSALGNLHQASPTTVSTHVYDPPSTYTDANMVSRPCGRQKAAFVQACLATVSTYRPRNVLDISYARKFGIMLVLDVPIRPHPFVAQWISYIHIGKSVSEVSLVFSPFLMTPQPCLGPRPPRSRQRHRLPPSLPLLPWPHPRSLLCSPSLPYHAEGRAYPLGCLRA